MKRITILLGLTLASLAVLAHIVEGDNQSSKKEGNMIARGTFEVKVTPQPQDEGRTEPFGRLLLDKQFRGDLEAAGKGQMLGAETAIKGSGAYVALEFVTGSLHGKSGSFILQHKGTMRKGNYMMNVTVVPDSGTNELTGIAGAMTIIIEGAKHSYEFEYSFEEK